MQWIVKPNVVIGQVYVLSVNNCHPVCELSVVEVVCVCLLVK